MPNLTALTLKQMRDSTKNQIADSVKTYLQTNFTKKQLIQFLRDRDSEWSDPVCTYFPDGQISSQTEVETDAETDVQISKKIITFSYYNTGEVNKIIIQTLDGNDVKTKIKTIKHYKDSRQPEVS